MAKDVRKITEFDVTTAEQGRRTDAVLRCNWRGCGWTIRSVDAFELSFEWLNHSRYHWNLEPLPD